MTLGRRIAEHFVLPADGREPRADAAPAGAPPSRACAVPQPRTPICVALLAPPAEAPSLGASLGLALAHRERAPAAVVCVWSVARDRPRWRAPALPAAARLASALAARRHDASAAGRLATVRLAADGEEAATEAGRVAAAAGAAPTVLVLGGPRVAAFDAILAAQDLVVAAVPAGADPALARLAVAGFERGVACELPSSHRGRALAASGLMLLPSRRRALAAPVATLP